MGTALEESQSHPIPLRTQMSCRARLFSSESSHTYTHQVTDKPVMSSPWSGSSVKHNSRYPEDHWEHLLLCSTRGDRLVVFGSTVPLMWGTHSEPGLTTNTLQNTAFLNGSGIKPPFWRVLKETKYHSLKEPTEPLEQKSFCGCGVCVCVCAQCLVV